MRRRPRLAQEQLISAVDRLPLGDREALALGLRELVRELGIGGASAPMFFEEGAVTLSADDLLETVRRWISTHGPGTSHQGFPVVDAKGELAGVVTRRDLLDPERPGAARVRELIRRPVAVVFEDNSLREAADHMVREEIGRLPVVSRSAPRKPIGMLTRSDLLPAHRRRLDETHVTEQSLSWWPPD